MEVSDTQLLSPTVKRVNFTGDLTDVVSKPGSFIDFRVNDTDSRRYTVSAIDFKQDIIECIAHLHGDGPGSQFMEALQIGDQLQMNRLRNTLFLATKHP
jgi:NAD(P)H-flavin reductase